MKNKLTDVRVTRFETQLESYIVFQMGANAFQLYEELYGCDNFFKLESNPFLFTDLKYGFKSQCLIATDDDIEHFCNIEQKCEEAGLFIVDKKPLTKEMIDYMKEIIKNKGRAISYDGGESWYRIDGIRLWRGGMFVSSFVNKYEGVLGNITSLRAVASYDKVFKLRDHVFDDKTNEDYIEDTRYDAGTNVLPADCNKLKEEPPTDLFPHYEND